MKKIIAVTLALAAPLSSQAGEWEYSLTPYLWLPTISMDSSRTPFINLPSIDRPGLDVGPTDYLEALDFGFMIAGDMRNDEFVFMGDYIYLDFSVDDKDINLIGAGLTPATYDMSLTGNLLTLLGGKTVIKKENYSMDLLAGWRYFDLEVELKRNAAVIPGLSGSTSPDLTRNDFILAVNGRYEFSNEEWSLPYYADIGTGESDLTWQAMVGVDYQFDWGKLFANYRHLDYDMGDAKSFTDLELTFSGPSFGARFEF